jgi:hypothetical protein
MADYIAFIRGRDDAALSASLYPNAAAYWVPKRLASKLVPLLPDKATLWLDASIDGLRYYPDFSDTKYRDYISQFPHYDQIGGEDFQKKPSMSVITAFVDAVLSETINGVAHVDWLSVPQLPYFEDRKRNAINKALAQATRQWLAKGKFRGRLVLPVILTHGRQLAKKGQRDPYVATAVNCLALSGAESAWIVDSSLNDQDGKGTFEHQVFPGLVRFHEELSNKWGSECRTIAGPYWGMNLILWSRQLVQHPAIALGKAYQYYIPGNQFSSPSLSRVALPGLRRMALCTPDLKTWLGVALSKVGRESPIINELTKLEKQFDQFKNNDSQAKKQVAVLYKEWIEKIEVVRTDGRAVALYQDFSSAYVLGKSLPDLRGQEKVKSVSKIPKQFMSNCL